MCPTHHPQMAQTPLVQSDLEHVLRHTTVPSPENKQHLQGKMILYIPNLATMHLIVWRMRVAYYEVKAFLTGYQYCHNQAQAFVQAGLGLQIGSLFLSAGVRRGNIDPNTTTVGQVLNFLSI